MVRPKFKFGSKVNVNLEIGPMLATTLVASLGMGVLAYASKLDYKLASKRLDKGLEEGIQESFAENA